MTKRIAGAGGGGGQSQTVNVNQSVQVYAASRTPIKQADNLASKSFGRILDLISEGEIEGFPSARDYTRGTDAYNVALLKDVYLTNTPILRSGADPTNPQGNDYNFQNVTVTPRYGTQAQDYIPGFGAVEDIKSVGIFVRNGSGDTASYGFTTQRENDSRSGTVATGVTDCETLTVTVSYAWGGDTAPALRQTLRVYDSSDTLVGSQYGTGASGSFTLSLTGLSRSETFYFTVTADSGTQAGSTYNGFAEITASGNVAWTYTNEDVSSQAVVRSITDVNVDATRVTITVPRLEQFGANGDLIGSSVQLGIDVQYNGGGFTRVKTDTITGRTADAYQRDYVIEFDGDFPIDLKVSRLSPDSGEDVANDFVWTSYTELINTKFAYPNSALVGLRFDAEEFNSIPARTYRIRGIKVALPNNATVDADNGRVTYEGAWTGTFGAAQWCSDPAWILWDLLTNTRYGFGNHIDAAQLDKFAFYAASQYCSALVDDGFGGTEPRFSCNVLIQNQYEAYKLINDLCSVMRCQPYWSTGAMTIAQDKPTDSTYLFTRANVVEPGFTYSGSDLKTRHTVAVVGYLDMATRDINYEVVEDRAGIEKYGVVSTEVKAFACTSRGQAHRLGEWLLYSEQNETEIVSFAASIEAGTLVRPGSVIDINDPVRAGVRYGGRIVGSGAKTISVDDATNLPTSNATLSVLLPDGSVETKNVTSRTGTLITVDENWTTQPNKNSVWIIQTTTIQTSQWRVLTVQETEGHIYGITALAYNATKYAYVERGVDLQARDVTDLNPVPDPPENLTGQERFYEQNNKTLVKIILSWKSIVGVSQYKVRWREQNGNWNLETVNRPDHEILNTTNTRYEVEVYSINALGRPSTDFASLTFNAIGKTAVPQQVQNLRFEATNEKEGMLKWDETTELDVKNGGRVYIRHSNLTDGSATWSNSVDLIEAVAGSATSAKIPLIEGQVFAKFADDGGRLSTTETSLIIDLPDTLGRLLLQNRREDQDAPPFQGQKTDTFYSEEFDALTLDGTDEIDDVTDIDDLPSFDFTGAIAASGEYAFTDTLDLEGVFSLDLERRFVTRGFYPGDLIDAKTELIDDWDDFDGDTVDKVNAKLLVRRTDDDPTGTPTWTSWQDFANGTFKGRAFQFKAELTSSDTAQNILVDELGYLAQFARRQEQSSEAVASGAGAKAVTFANAFFTGTASLLGTNTNLPSIGITAQNMQSGDYFEVSSVSATGFTVTFKNSSDTAVDRNFNWTAVGYGKAG